MSIVVYQHVIYLQENILLEKRTVHSEGTKPRKHKRTTAGMGPQSG